MAVLVVLVVVIAAEAMLVVWAILTAGEEE
jgi:hypothetical protein